MPTLFHVHDPMCSWCYAYQPVLMQIRRTLAGQLDIVNLVGGLAPDSDVPMPQEMQTRIQSYWRKIEQETGTSFNHDFWQRCQPRRSTYPSCRAVIAASWQQAEDAMIHAIQQAYYQRAMNPSDEDTLLQLADELGLDFDRFMQDMESEKLEQELQRQIQLARSMGANSFPSWVLQADDRVISIPVDYHSAHTTLALISDSLRSI